VSSIADPSESQLKERLHAEARDIEELIDEIDAEAEAICGRIDQAADMFKTVIDDYLVEECLDEALEAAKEPVSFSANTPDTTYWNVSVRPTGRYMAYTIEEMGLSTQQLACITAMTGGHERSVRELKQRLEKLRQKQEERYSELLTLTMINTPFDQRRLLGSAIIYFAFPEEESLFRAQLYFDEERCDGPARTRLPNMQELIDDVISYMKTEAQDEEANIYIAGNPSRRLGKEQVFGYVVRKVRENCRNTGFLKALNRLGDWLGWADDDAEEEGVVYARVKRPDGKTQWVVDYAPDEGRKTAH
jgi:hypothetical protein